jgi:hypothetical protein
MSLLVFKVRNVMVEGYHQRNPLEILILKMPVWNEVPMVLDQP